jgi:hypothetical protein
MPDPQVTAHHRGALWPAVALLAAVAGVLGAGADRLLFAGPARVAAAQDAGATGGAQEKLEHELSALSAAITQLQQSVDKLAQPAPPPAPAADVQATLARLVAAVSDATQQIRASTTAPLVVPEPDGEMAHRLGALPIDSATLNAQHLFWTAQSVLDVYGRPTNVYVHDRGEQWEYVLASPHTITFTFHEGHVIEVEAH